MSGTAPRWIARIAATTVAGIVLLGLPTAAFASPPSGKVYVGDVSVAEGNAGFTNALFTISLSPARGSASVDWATAPGTATAGADYTTSGGHVTVSKTTPSVQVAVPVLGDTIDEPNETFAVNLSNASGGSIGDAQGIGTITDDDASVTIAVSDAPSVTEGNAGTTNAVFTVSLSGPSSQTVTVNAATASGTATAPSDYAATSGPVSFAPGETSKIVNVAVNGDTIDEADETFTLNLSGATNATIADAQGVGTIADDDDAELSVADVTVPEGNAGTSTATFTVSLSVPSAQTVTVSWATSDDSATAPADYGSGSGPLTFTPGQTSKTVGVTVKGDTIDEPDETFSVDLSGASGAPVADGHAVGTIADDDAAPTLSVGDATIVEGDAGTTTMTFTVSLSAASGKAITVHVATADGTATAPRDYASTSGDLTFAPGDTSKTVNVVLGTDTWYELDETLTLDLSAPTNATIADGSGLGTIVNDDALVGVDVGDVTVVEGDAGTTSAVFPVTLTGPSGMTTTVDWSTADATATAGQDYTPASGSITFPAGVTSRQVSVDVLGDTTDEPSETFTVNLANPLNAGLSTAVGTATITDDDPAVTVLTMTLRKGRRTLSASGLLSPSAQGMRVSVKLLKKKGARYVKVSTRAVTVGAIGDRNGDGIPDAPFAAKFRRPAAGTYKVIASYAGDPDHLPCSVARRVRL